MSLLVGAATRHRATVAWIRRNIDGVVVRCLLRKVGHQCTVLRHRESVVGIGAHLLSVLGPIHEFVSIGCRGNQCTALAVVVRAISTHCSSSVRVSHGSYRITHFGEIGRQGAVGVHNESPVGMGRDHFAVFRPVGEGKAFVSRCPYGALLALLVSAATRHCATFLWVGRRINCVFGRSLNLEVGCQGAVARHGEGVFRKAVHLFAVLRPVHKGKAWFCRGIHRAALPLLVGATARHRAAFRRVGRNVDGVFVGL